MSNARRPLTASAVTLLALGAGLLACTESPTEPRVGQPVAVLAVSGDGQINFAQNDLTFSLVVEVRDARGRRVPMAEVAWAVTVGSGFVTPREGLTDENGLAQATLRLGPELGEQRVVAVVGNDSAEFIAFAQRRPAVFLAVVGGDGQRQVVGTTLSEPIVVRAQDDLGAGVPDQPVVFRVVFDGATQSVDTVVTGPTGLASTTVTLGTTPGFLQITARLGDLGPAYIFADVLPIPVANIAVLRGNNQTARVTEWLPDSIAFRVTDANGAPLPGRVVFFNTNISSSSHPLADTTDSDGVVSLRLRLGNGRGITELNAVSEGVRATATATALEGPPVLLRFISGRDQDAERNTTLASPIVIQLEDQFSNPTPGVPVTVTVPAGSGGVLPASPVTDSLGRVSLSWTIGEELRQHTATISVAGMGDSTVRASATPPVVALAERAVDAAFHAPSNRLVTVSAAPNVVSVRDAAVLAVQTIALPAPPTALSLSADGTRAAVGHDGYVSIVDLNTGTVLATHLAGMNVGDVVLAPNGYAYVLPKFEYMKALTAVDVVTGARFSAADTAYPGSTAHLSATGEFLYVSSFADYLKYDIRSATALRLNAPQFIQQYGIGERFWADDIGLRLFTRLGSVIRRSDTPGEDLQYETTIPGAEGLLSWITASQVAARTAVFSYTGPPLGNAARTFSVHNNDFFALRGRVPLPSLAFPDGVRLPGIGLFAFFSADGSKLYVLAGALGAGPTPLAWGLVSYDVADLP